MTDVPLILLTQDLHFAILFSSNLAHCTLYTGLYTVNAIITMSVKHIKTVLALFIDSKTSICLSEFELLCGYYRV